jgi:stearoyl-CoA desaturase (delta-9 desaturase)
MLSAFAKKYDIRQLFGFFAIHAAAIYLASQADWSWPWILVGFVAHQLRFFFYSAFLHRYFSHKSFHTSRAFQFLMGLAVSTLLMRGPNRYVAVHRLHHRASDQPEDLHSPRRGFIQSYCGWAFLKSVDEEKIGGINDLKKFPELVFLSKHYVMPTVLLSILFYALGGVNLLFWGIFFGVLATWHLAFWIAWTFHRPGHKNYEIDDLSRNSLPLSLITMGEGWHNNHHYAMNRATFSTRSGEIDIGYYGLKLLDSLGLIRLPTLFKSAD